MKSKLQTAYAGMLGILICAASGAEPAASARIQEFVEQGKLDEALSATNAELKDDMASVTYRFLKGSILTRMNRMDEAAEIFLELTNEHPELPEPYNNLAVVYAAQGDFEKARQALQKAINTHPSYATAHENLGDIYAKMASQAYNHALQLDQDNSTAKAKLSLITNLFPAPQPEAATVAQATPAKTARPAPAPMETRAATPAPTAAETPSAAKPVVAEAAPVEATPGTAAPSAPASPPAATKPSAAPAAMPAAVAARPVVADPAASLEAVRRAVDLWATAWSSKDADAYLAFYADDFSPADGRPRGEWAAWRRERLAAPHFIQVEISDLNVTMMGEDHAQAAFWQDYQSDTIDDRIRKTLLLKKTGERWMITQETIR